MLPLSLEQKDEGLQPVDASQDGDGDDGECAGMGAQAVKEVSEVGAGGWQDNGAKEINKHHETHAKAAKSAKIFQKDELSQVVDRRVDPSSSLREKNTPCRGSCGRCVRIGNEFIRHVRKVFRHERGQISVFTKGQKVLLVQRVNVNVAVLFNDLVRDDQRPALVLGS